MFITCKDQLTVTLADHPSRDIGKVLVRRRSSWFTIAKVLYHPSYARLICFELGYHDGKLASGEEIIYNQKQKSIQYTIYSILYAWTYFQRSSLESTVLGKSERTERLIGRPKRRKLKINWIVHIFPTVHFVANDRPI